MSLIKRNKGYNNDKYVDYHHWYEVYPNDPYISANFNDLKELNNGRLEGYDTPNFHRRVKRGELLPMTPFEQFQVYGTSEGDYDVNNVSTHGYVQPSGCYVYRSYWTLNEDILRGYAPALSNDLAQDAAAKIYSSGFDALTFLAELTDMKRLFTQIGKKFLAGGLPTNWRKLSSDWLAARYGLRPLINDIKSLNELCETYGDEIVRRKDRAGRSWSTQEVSSWTENATICTLNHLVTDKIEISLRASVVADIDVPKVQFNPLVTGWEVVPFSFVIDWLATIGKSLAAISFLSLSTNYSACVGYNVKVNRSYSMSSSNWVGAWSGTYEQYGDTEATLQVRRPCTIPITPYPRLNLDWKKILDLVSLIIQRK